MKPGSLSAIVMPMTMPTPTPGAITTFEALLPTRAGVTSKKMFGQPAAFVNGTMFLGVFGDRVFLRLSEVDRAEAGKTPGFTTFEPMPGRAMREYLVLPPQLSKDLSRAKVWVARSLSYAAGLPGKKPRKRG